MKFLKKIYWETLFILFPKWAIYHISKQEFKEKLMDPTFNTKQFEGGVNPYFKKWGFKISNLECRYFSMCTGVESDLYVPVGLFNRFILPYLNNMNWRYGFADKNISQRILNISKNSDEIDVRLPECIVSCQNGRYFIGQNAPCSYNEVVERILEWDNDFIIKPAVDSSHGKGVKKVLKSEISKDNIDSILKKYEKNFTIQKVVEQHPVLAAFNPTSVNTIRIATYQDFEGKVKVLYAAQRFGGKGMIYDNADDPKGSGGFCAISMDGTIDRHIHHYRNSQSDVLINKDIPEKIPYFEKIKEAVVYLHRFFPHYALIGWDASLTPDGHPIIIEYNFVPGLGTAQLGNHPIFEKNDLDEIMERVSKMRPRLSAHLKMKY